MICDKQEGTYIKPISIYNLCIFFVNLVLFHCSYFPTLKIESIHLLGSCFKTIIILFIFVQCIRHKEVHLIIAHIYTFDILLIIEHEQKKWRTN